MRKVASTKGAKGRRKTPMRRADEAFAKIVRLSGPCRKCGTTVDLQCAHIFSRSYKAIRCDLGNAIPLCRSDHVYFTHHPLEWENWIVDQIGTLRYAELRHHALTYARVDWVAVAADLEAQLAELDQ